MAADRPASTKVHVFPNHEALSRAVAEEFIACAQNALAEGQTFTVALAGGSTPERLYELLASTYRDRLPWGQLHLFWGDERYVPAEHGASNYRRVCEALLRHVPIPEAHVHRIPTDISPPEEAAIAYEQTLRRFVHERPEAEVPGGSPALDLVLLGLGADGHTASLFPEDAPHEQPAAEAPWVQAVTAPPRHTPRQRITLTLPALSSARDIFFLVSGTDKHNAVQSVLEDADPALPATHVHAQGRLQWFLDEDAHGQQV